VTRKERQRAGSRFKAEIGVIYFFSKGDRFVQCEIYPGRPHVLTVVDASGVERTERFHAGGDLHDRWTEVQQQLLADGWSGPLGRDARG
jgi:hypothetical protein